MLRNYYVVKKGNYYLGKCVNNNVSEFALVENMEDIEHISNYKNAEEYVDYIKNHLFWNDVEIVEIRVNVQKPMGV